MPTDSTDDGNSILHDLVVESDIAFDNSGFNNKNYPDLQAYLENNSLSRACNCCWWLFLFSVLQILGLYVTFGPSVSIASKGVQLFGYAILLFLIRRCDPIRGTSSADGTKNTLAKLTLFLIPIYTFGSELAHLKVREEFQNDSEECGDGHGGICPNIVWSIQASGIRGGLMMAVNQNLELPVFTVAGEDLLCF
ncbi:hypothetical protein CYMTET_46152 [Cymbomonas tetramitiformis]|uniref:Uncharacterized protein n=1 Tax=Cymbomonas tetramitiformis TaxID=36881 RepID=A0AAE0BWQ8_9CHLO|nr:hypothetical protein CYMTET_46152 [Cymbomonas tetramitiformis]